MTVYRCKGCGATDSIGEISVVPRFVVIRPDGEYLSRGWGDECFWESETVLGYACDNEQCEYWQGNYGTPSREMQVNAHGSFVEFDMARTIEDIADSVEESA